MNTAMIQARYAGHPFLDYQDCLQAAVEAAKRRNKLAVRARKAGDFNDAANHQELVHHYLTRARQWFDMIDWSAE